MKLKTLINILDTNYNIEINNISNIKTSGINLVWFLEAEKGGFIFKKINHENNKDWLKFANNTFNLLKENKIEKLLIESHEKSFFVHNEFGLWSLSKFVETSPFQFLDKTILKSISSYQKSMTNLTSSLNREYEQNIDKMYCQIKSWYMDPVNQISQLQFFLEKYKNFDIDNKLNDMVDNLNKILYDTDINIYNSLPKVISHGEFQNNNLIIRNNKIYSAIDWDQLLLRPRIVDIASNMCFACRTRRGQFKLSMNHVDFYLKLFQLSNDELYQIPVAALFGITPPINQLLKFEKYCIDKLKWYIPWFINAVNQISEKMVLLTK